MSTGKKTEKYIVHILGGKISYPKKSKIKDTIGDWWPLLTEASNVEKISMLFHQKKLMVISKSKLMM